MEGKNSILMHMPKDDVGVAVADLKSGEEIGVVTLEGEPIGKIRLVNDIPFLRELGGFQLQPGGGWTGRCVPLPACANV